MTKDKQLLEASQELKVQAIRDSNLAFLMNYLSSHEHLQCLLEIGTGCGYSSYQFAKVDSIQKIITLERDNQRFLMAQKLLVNESKIELVNTDALTYNPEHKYDVIFLDGPKKSTPELIDKFLPFVNHKGILVIDNIYLNDIKQKYEQTKQARLLPLIESSYILQTKLKELDKKRYNLLIDSSSDGLAIIEVF